MSFDTLDGCIPTQILHMHDVCTSLVKLTKLQPRPVPRTPTAVAAKEPEDAGPIVKSAFKFMKSYSHLATLALKDGRPLFKYSPKGHYLHHIVLDIRSAQMKGHPALNPLGFSCASAEDFIGRVSLISRRVSAATVEKRTLQRWLSAAMQQWNSD